MTAKRRVAQVDAVTDRHCSNCAPERSRLDRIGKRLTDRLPERYAAPTPRLALQRVLRRVTSGLFMAVDRVGVHILPKHFYTPIPDYAWLRANRQFWDSPAPMTGIDWDLDRQLEWLRTVCEPWLGEVAGLESVRAIEESGYGPGFGPIDAQVLHCFIRSARPSRIIEIGSGMSTALMLAADQRNQQDGNAPGRIVAIDPYPQRALLNLPGPAIIPDLVQRVPLKTFDELEAGDLLFIDSSHAVKTGSDVVHVFLRVIPGLAPGVVVHVHDVSLPYLYSRTALEDYFGWQESALLAALLTGNRSLRPLASLAALHYDRQDALKQLLPDYRPQEDDAGLRTGDWAGGHFPDSFWMVTA